TPACLTPVTLADSPSTTYRSRPSPAGASRHGARPPASVVPRATEHPCRGLHARLGHGRRVPIREGEPFQLQQRAKLKALQGVFDTAMVTVTRVSLHCTP